MDLLRTGGFSVWESVLPGCGEAARFLGNGSGIWLTGEPKRRYSTNTVTFACLKLECSDGIPLCPKSSNLRFESDVVSSGVRWLN